ncbi:MAG: 23S rRNA (adenine(2503)-C(2))-methyltransferase RlmN [Coriobacteriales bacterium]|nr:23S rRNA (adenine(2503)-C(2))-methyltransferase RlmN [Coriobacteriales bacterium]
MLAKEIGIYRYGIADLGILLTDMGEPRFRAGQLLTWLYGHNGHGVGSYQEMSNLSLSLRERLAAAEPLVPPRLVECQVSRDGTRKYLLELVDGCCIECVGIPDAQRLTVCFSTQVGCALGCSFCATGRLGLIRQLAPGEMVAQLLTVARDFDMRITNAVAMGEGEPFANYSATLDALRLINHPTTLNIGARHITVSTSGLISGIQRFADEPEQWRLAVSLHSAIQKTRDQLMPGLRGQTLDQLHDALKDYNLKSGRRVSLEYVLIADLNDDVEAIRALIGFCRGLNTHVNLIPLNPVDDRLENTTGQVRVPVNQMEGSAKQCGGRSSHAEGYVEPPSESAIHIGSPQRPSNLQRLNEIESQLNRSGIECSIRRSRGADIAGACGQLAGS